MLRGTVRARRQKVRGGKQMNAKHKARTQVVAGPFESVLQDQLEFAENSSKVLP